MKKIVLLLLLMLTFIAGYSQQSGLTEQDIIKKAESLLEKKNYQEAMPLFAQLVSIHPSNPEYNYKFGVCALFGDRTDRRRPIRYLNVALKSMGDDPGLNYHLGLAYYQNLEFTQAMKFFNLYLGKLGPGSPERPLILEKVNACLNGLNLEHTNLIDEIISKSEFKTDNFHRAYRADEFDGMLILKPDHLVTSHEKKTAQKSFVFLAEPKNTIYFSGYEGNATDRDIFRVTLDDKGEWSKPERLSDAINTPFDEDYPVVTNQGNTLYFCSKGHNSIGGYDVFKATLNPETNTFSTPENLGVGVNSPFDDILFIPDKTGNFAWFSTDRDNLNDAISVYKIRISDNYASKEKELAINSETENTNKLSVTSSEQKIAMTDPVQPKSTQQAVSSNQELSPVERAARLKTEMDMVNKMADTSYMWVTQTRNLIRDLGNKRDRANNVTAKKQETVKILEVKFEEMMTTMMSASSAIEFEKHLENAMNLKKEIYQYRMRADHANLIAWNLGKQLKIKNDEFEQVKNGAGKVQSSSMSGKVEDTKIAFLELKASINISDTLSDYTNQLMSISGDETTYEIPASELAFAEDLRKAYEANTLLAQIQKPQNQVKNEEPPIVIVDKRTQATSPKQPEQKSIAAVALVQEVIYDKTAYAMTFPEPDVPVINFGIDAIQPQKQVTPVEFNPSALALDFPESDLHLNSDFDLPKTILLVEPIHILFANNVDIPVHEQPEINFHADVVDPIGLVKSITQGEFELDLGFDEPEIRFYVDAISPIELVESIVGKEYKLEFAFEEPEINFTIDAVASRPLIAQIEHTPKIEKAIVPEEDIVVNHKQQELQASELVIQINYDKDAYAFTMDTDEMVEIALEDQKIIELEIIKPIDPVLISANVPAIDQEQIIEPEIYFDEAPVAIYALVPQIKLPEAKGIFMMGEDIELFIEPLNTPVIASASPVDMSLVAYNGIEFGEEPIELVFEDENFMEHNLAYKVTPVDIPSVATTYFEPEDSDLELRLEESGTKQISIVKQVKQVDYSFLENIISSIGDEYVEVRFLSGEQESPEEMLAIRTDLSSPQSAPDSLTDGQAIASGYLLLRESVSLPSDIETSRSDIELLHLALTKPDNLEYEELLYAASLANSAADKLQIFNAAFIHIDRDWRAFNNAGVTSMNASEIENAECYLYQASLISYDNGKIMNNMGILACLKKDYKSAGDHFIAASQLGVNAEYNLQVLQNITRGNQFNPEQMREEVGEHRYRIDLRKRDN